MDLPAVDVLIPARNAATTLEAAVRSALAQTAPHLRVIVIDDGSTDATPAVVDRLAAQDPRVQSLRLPGQGIAAAMNAGLALATAPFVARLDADDLSAPDRHARQLRHMVGNPACIACSGAHVEIDATGKETGTIHQPGANILPDPAFLPAQEPPLTQPFFMARRSALMAVGGYRPLPVSEDSDLYWRLTALGRLDTLPDILGRYRMHGGSISSASIQHGRQMALWSQLAALSAQRRRAGRPDLPIGATPPNHRPSAATLSDQVAAMVQDMGLTPPEAAWLAQAVAAKVMELAGYRPFELTAEDVAFVARQLADGRSDATLPHLAKMRAATAARLLRARRWAEAMHLGQGHRVEVVIRAAANRLYWTKRRA
ncbi:MAG: glycosyl transferase [Rhodobacteraceae bacterium PARR1]|nr:MAG: glycosyl transferase [Rhodobacteraceae bacterium PARR1]